MNTFKITILNILSLLFCSCETEFELDQRQIEPTLIVEGWVYDNDIPIRVKLSESNVAPHPQQEGGFVTGNLVYDALVTVRSNKQPIDTLEVEFIQWDYPGSKPEKTGYYFTDKVKGIAGETYYLRIEHKQKVYEASAYMPEVAQIDTITFTTKKVKKENATLYVPMINFNDPGDEENYYMFREVRPNYADSTQWDIKYDTDPWMISLFTDDFINGKKAALNVMEGVKTERYYMEGTEFLGHWGMMSDFFTIQMQSMTKEAHDYYFTLINQLNYAAGVFHPSPANPPTNISNGGQGFFGASAVSYGTAKMPGRDFNY